MSHPRKAIRDFVATLLTDATPAGARVYPSRALDLEQLKEPAIAVFDDSESVEDPEADYPRRELTLLVEIHTNQSDPRALDNAMDALALAVEIALDSNPRMDNRVISTLYQGMKKDRDAKGNTVVGVMVMEFAVEYTVRLPELTLPDFEVLTNQYENHPGSDDRVELEQDE